MSDLRQIDRKFLLEFIELYRSLPCVWKIKSREYSDRIKKDKAYQRLLTKLREVNAEATKEGVKKKIDSLRAGYRRELKKVNASKKTGTGSEDVYTPNLWYFDDLSFLNDQEITRSGSSNLEEADEDLGHDSNDDDNDDNSQEDTNESQHEEDNQLLSPQSNVSSLHESMPPIASSRSPSAPSTSRSSIIIPTSKGKKAKISADDILTRVNQKLQDEKVDDEFDVIGKNVANKLRKLSAATATIIEKFVMDILFEAQLGNINRHSKLNISQTVQQQPPTFTTLGPVPNNVQPTTSFTAQSFLSHYNPDNSFNHANSFIPDNSF